MAASYINILKSYANFTNLFLKETSQNQRMAASISLPLLWISVLVASTRKIKIHGSEFTFFVLTFRNFEEIII